MIDNLKVKLQSAVIILASYSDGKVSFAVGVTDDLTQNFKAGDIAKELGEAVGGKGGGRDKMAMAGGTKAAEIKTAILKIKTQLEK